MANAKVRATSRDGVRSKAQVSLRAMVRSIAMVRIGLGLR
jgi:hypothetical protein